MYGSLNASPEASLPLIPAAAPAFSNTSRQGKLEFRKPRSEIIPPNAGRSSLLFGSQHHQFRPATTPQKQWNRNNLSYQESTTKPTTAVAKTSSTEISRSAVAKTWLPKRRRGLCSGVKRTTSRGFCDAARGASSRSPDHCRCLCWLSTRPTDRLDRCWPWSVCPVWKRVSMGGCNKGSVHTRISELYYCILEWMTDRLWITFPFDPCWYLLSFRVITTSRDWSWQLNSTSKVQIEKVRTYCNCNEKEWLTEITQQPIAVSTQINVTYINHMNSIWVHMNCYCCLLWLLFWRHIWEIKSLWVYSPEQYHCLWDRMRVVLGCLGVFWFYGILKKEYLAYISKNSPLSIFTKKGSLNKK